MKKNYSSLLIIAFIGLLSFTNESYAATYYSRITGNWGTASTWSTASCGGAAAASTPGSAAGDIVIICSGNTITVAANPANAIASVTVQSGGTLICGSTGGGANKEFTITAGGTFNINNGGTYQHNTTSAAATTIFAGTEVFGATSTFTITKWSGDTDRLITGCSSNFGHLTLNYDPGAFIWQNDGLGSTRTIQGDLTVGALCATLLDQSTANITVPIGGNMTISGSLYVKYTTVGNLTMSVAGNTTVTGTFRGVYNNNGNFTFSTVGSYSQSAGTFYGIYNGNGIANYTIGTYAQSGGDFRGIQNNATFAAGTASFSITTVNFTGGSFLGNYACHVGGNTVNFAVSGNMTITYSSTADLFSIIRLATLSATNNTMALNMTVGGNLTIGGVNGEFNSNVASGIETITITGNATISNGDNSFNAVQNSGLTTGHATTISIGGSLTFSGGITMLSSMTGTLTATVTGAVSISGGTLVSKGDVGVGTVNFNSTYTQTAGTFYLHHHPSAATTNVTTVNVQGNFSQTGTGIINFDNITTSTATNLLNLYGSTYTVGGTASMTHASAGTGSVFGDLHFARTGTTTFSRSSATHSIQQVRQYVDAVCTVNASASANPLQIASNLTAANISTNALVVNGILDMGANTITAVGPSLTLYNSGITVNGRLRTSHTSGFYNGTTTACLQPQPFAADVLYRMDFNLNSASTVEYYAAVNQTVTGKFPNAGALGDVAAGTAAQYKYGYLDINNLGTLGTNYAFPAVPGSGTGNVFVRTSLVLTRGELFLTGSGTGQTITIENAATSGITRDGATTTGYIKSEENLATNRAIVQWNIGATNGTYVLPFGLSNTYIPFTFAKTAGSSNMQFSTRTTAANTNLPWTTGVSTMSTYITVYPDGTVQSIIDRWWDITALSGSTSATADLTFSYRGIENTTTLAPTGAFGAQHWNGTSWDVPVGAGTGVVAGVGTVTVAGANTFSPWVLSSSQAPLPIELLFFDALMNGDQVDLKWATASETSNDYFIIEKSKDGQNFELVSKVDGAGNSSSINNYFDIDNNPYTGVSYYRLKQTDYNGETSYSNIVPVEFNANAEPSISVFPNPNSIGNASYVSLNSFKDNEVTVVLRDATGREVFSTVVNTKTDSEIVALDPEGKLSKGIYLVTVSGANQLSSKKLIVK